MKRCPKCGNMEFEVTWHVTQSVIVDGNGDFIREVSSCNEVTHHADDEDIWDCTKCGYSDTGAKFNVRETEQGREQDEKIQGTAQTLYGTGDKAADG